MTTMALHTTDRAEAETFLNQDYSLVIDPPRPSRSFGLHYDARDVGPTRLIRVSYDMTVVFRAVNPIESTHITCLRQGELGFRIAEHDNRWRSGDVYVGVHAGCTWEVTIDHCRYDTVTIDPATFASVASEEGETPVALAGYEPVSTHAAQLWLTTSAYAWYVAEQPGTTPLVAGQTARLLASTALACFPSNAVLDPTIEDRHDAHPLTVRRAIAFMESSLDLDLGISDIAQAAHVTPRALQLAFRRHLDTTPMAHLRHLRLERAHADLVAADPATATVTAIASRWGFGDPGRFAGHYRRTYGRSPSATLNRFD